MKWKKGFWITKMFPFDCVIKNLIELFIDGFYGKMYGLVNDEKPDHTTDMDLTMSTKKSVHFS